MGKFKFKTRKQELKDSNVNVASLIVNESPLSLLEAISREYDKSPGYMKLKEQIFPMVGNLELTLFYLESITDHIVEALTECVSPVLSLLKGLARDVRHELYPHFPKLLESLTSLCGSDKYLDQIFVTIGIVLKYMQKGIQDHSQFFALFDPIFGHRNPQVRFFGCQSLAFVCKKAPKSCILELLDRHGLDVWPLIRQSISKFNAKEMLEMSWQNLEMARNVHLSLARENKHHTLIWQSLVSNKAIDIMIEWLLMFNGNFFSFADKFCEYCLENKEGKGLAYLIKYNPQFIDKVPFLLEGQVTYLQILIDMEDPHPEQQIHYFFTEKAYKNRVNHIDLEQYSQEICQFLDHFLLKDENSLELLVFVIQNNGVIGRPLQNLNARMEGIEDSDLYWLALRAGNLTNTNTNPPKFRNEFINREIHAIGDEIKGEELWTIAEKNIQVDLDIVEPFLVHPVLRIPALSIMKNTYPELELLYGASICSSTLENEKAKINDLKNFTIAAQKSQNTRIIALGLAGFFHERLATLWPHTCMSLKYIGHPDIVWGVIWDLLRNPPSAPEYPTFYQKYNSMIEYAPLHSFAINLLKTLKESPVLVKSHLEDFVSFFKDKFYNEITLYYWVPGFPLPQFSKSSSTINLLVSFLEVLKNLKKIGKLGKDEELADIFLGICACKVESFRELAVDCLLNVDEGLKEHRELLKGLAKKTSMQESLLHSSEKLSKVWIALLAGRGLSTHPSHKSALVSISNFTNCSELLKYLPFLPHSDNIKSLINFKVKKQVKYLKWIRNIIKYCPLAFENIDDLIEFLLSLYYSQTISRQVQSSAIVAVNKSIENLPIKDQYLEKLVDIIDTVKKTFAHDNRPKLTDMLFLIVNEYPVLRSHESMLIACTNLMKNPKITAQTITSALKSLDTILQCTEAPQEYWMSLIESFQVVLETHGFLTGSIQVLSRIPSNLKLDTLISLLIPYYTKNDKLQPVLSSWMEHTQDPPLSEIANLLLKHSSCASMAAGCLESPAKSILLNLFKMRRIGLIEEESLDDQLAALQEVTETSPTLQESRFLVYAISHKLTSNDLGIRSSAAKALIHLIPFNRKAIEKALEGALLRCRDEDQVRAVMEVWNNVDIPELANEDRDASFFILLGHLQIHRRQRLFNHIASYNIPQEYLQKIVLPCINFYLVFSSMKKNYNQSFMMSLSNALKYVCPMLTWKKYFKNLKMYARSIEKDEKSITRCLASALSSYPDLNNSHKSLLRQKILPVIKEHIADKKKVTIRKYAVSSMFKLVSIFPRDEFKLELQRLLFLLTSYYKKPASKDSVISSVKELINQGCYFKSIYKEFKYGLDEELFTLFLTQILPSSEVSENEIPHVVQLLVKYEQYQSFYHLACKVSSSHLDSLLGSTKALPYISQGLADNSKISAEDLISLGTSLLAFKAGKEEKKDYSLKEKTFMIQSDQIPVADHKKKEGHKVIGMRLLKLGLKRSEEGISQEVAELSSLTAVNCLNSTNDEVVSGALEIIRLLEDTSCMDEVIQLSHRPSYHLSSQIYKTIGVLLRKDKSLLDRYGEDIIENLVFALNNAEMLPSVLKLIRLLVHYKVMDSKIYDLMEMIPELFISFPSYSKQVSRLYTHFLMEYPLSDERLQWHLDFLLKNLEISPGPIVSALNLIIEQFPEDIIRGHITVIVLSFVSYWSNCNLFDQDLVLKIIDKFPGAEVNFEVCRWIHTDNQNLQKTALLYLIVCLDKTGLPKREMNKIPKLLMSIGECFHIAEYTEALVKTYIKNKSEDLYHRIYQSINKALDDSVLLKTEIFSIIDVCDMMLLQKILKSIEQDCFSEGIHRVFEKLEEPDASKKISGLVRKLIGRKVEDSRVVELLNGLILLVNNEKYNKKSMLKCFYIINELATNELVKDLNSSLFTLIHGKMSETEFLELYTSTQHEIVERRREKKQKAKLRAVENPALSITLKQKKRLKKRLKSFK